MIEEEMRRRNGHLVAYKRTAQYEELSGKLLERIK
jgi:hypothetical protein